MAHLLIIELPGGNDADILEAALRRGDEFTFLSAQIDHYRRQPALKALLAAARELIEVPSFEAAEVQRRVLDADARLHIDAVLCLIDTRLPEAARLACRLGLPFLNPASAALVRDKFSVRRRLAECGLEQPAFALAESNDELRQAVDRLGLPVLIKPADGYGSQNIVVLRHPEDLDPWLTPLDDMLPSRADYGLGVHANDRLVVERFMTGTLIACDTLTVDGKHRLLGVNEKLLFEPPSFAIRGGAFTPNGGQFEAIEQYAFAVLDGVGFDWGAAHIELMLTAGGLRLIEINARLVGAKLPRLVGYALGRSLHEDLICVHLGHWPSAASTPPQRSVAVMRWIVADQAGVLDGIELPPPADAGIRCVELIKAPGCDVRPPMENADRLGYVMACAPSRSEAERLAEAFVSRARIHLKRAPVRVEPAEGRKVPQHALS